MQTPDYSQDPMFQFSVPASVQKTKLTTLYNLKTRNNPAKPGRAMTVIYDARNLLIANSPITYQYVVEIEPGCFAGNHYHSKKEELYLLLTGQMQVELASVATGEREVIELKSKQLIFIPAQHAHKVSSKTGGLLLVMATHAEGNDEFKYEFKN